MEPMPQQDGGREGELSLAWCLPVPKGCCSVSIFSLICQATNQVQPWYLWMAYSKNENYFKCLSNVWQKVFEPQCNSLYMSPCNFFPEILVKWASVS